MYKIWKLRDVKEKAFDILYKPEGIYINFKDIDIRQFVGFKFNEKLKTELIDKSSPRFIEFTKNIPNILVNNIIVIKKEDNSYLVFKVSDNPAIVDNSIIIPYHENQIVNNPLKLPARIRIDGRTKVRKFKEITSRERSTLYEICNSILTGEDYIYKKYQDFFLDKSRQATDSAKGYIEQALIALYFIFHRDNYKKIKNLKIEGVMEDIEIQYRDNSFDFIQVKIAESPNKEENFVTKRFTEALVGLKSTQEKSKILDITAKSLVYASNTIHQPLERQTGMLKSGRENFYESSEEDFTSDEILKLKENYNLDEEFIEKFSIARVHPKFLRIDSSEYFDEFNHLNAILGTNDYKISIFNALKDLLMINSIIREEKVNIFEIAFSFLKIQKKSTKFNTEYSDDLENIDYEDIEDLISDLGLKEIINQISSQIPIVDYYLEKQSEFIEPNGELKLNNLKKFIDTYSSNMDEFSLFSHIKDSDKRDLLHKYILFKVFKNRGQVLEIFDNFKLEEL